MRATDSEWVAFIDSDGQCDPSDFARLVGLRSGADLIIGWRTPRSDTWVRKVMSGAFGVVYRRLFNVFNVRVRDPSFPNLLVHRPALQKIFAGNIGILKQGFWWEFLARAHAAGLRIVETACPSPTARKWRNPSVPTKSNTSDRGRASCRTSPAQTRTRLIRGYL